MTKNAILKKKSGYLVGDTESLSLLLRHVACEWASSQQQHSPCHSSSLMKLKGGLLASPHIPTGLQSSDRSPPPSCSSFPFSFCTKGKTPRVSSFSYFYPKAYLQIRSSLQLRFITKYLFWATLNS